MMAHLYYKPDYPHQHHVMSCLADGLQQHGIVSVQAPDWNVAPGIDFVVCWGDKVPTDISLPRLILEAGYINGQSGDYVQDRLQFVSAGWNGLHGRADPGPLDCPPDRWNALETEIMPWRKDDGKYVLICDQHPGDATSGPLKWWEPIADQLAQFKVIYRPHPLLASNLPPLSESLIDAGLVVTWSSTAAVEAVLAGVPTITRDQGSIAWPVTSHSLDDEVYLGTRDKWAYNLAYRQWTHHELQDGTAWEYLRYGIEANKRSGKRTGDNGRGKTAPQSRSRRRGRYDTGICQ